jgi:hypothetical protein
MWDKMEGSETDLPPLQTDSTVPAVPRACKGKLRGETVSPGRSSGELAKAQIVGSHNVYVVRLLHHLGLEWAAAWVELIA